jgi:serine/threonine protein kinase
LCANAADHTRISQFTTKLLKSYESDEISSLVVAPFYDETLSTAAFSMPVFVRAVEALAIVLPYLHHSGIVHGDMSPSNILVNSADSSVRINDFGGSVAIGKPLRHETKDYAPISFSPANQVTVTRANRLTFGLISHAG